MSSTKMKIAFVTDSTCDLPAEFIQQHNIHVVPCFINYGGGSYLDDASFSREQFYEMLATMKPHPTTAAPSPGMAEKAIKAAAATADHVIIVTAPAKLSGIHNTMRLAASTNLPPERFTLIDGGSPSMVVGYQVQIGVETAEATGDLNATVAAIYAVRENITLYAGLNTLQFLRAGGRVSWAAVSIGTLLNIKPVIEVHDGEVDSVARVRTYNRAIDEMVQRTQKMAPLDRLTIIHTNAPDSVPALIERLGDLVPADFRVINVTPTLGTHVGPGAVGVVPLSKRWRQ